jgi:hypothetical protein
MGIELDLEGIEIDIGDRGYLGVLALLAVVVVLAGIAYLGSTITPPDAPRLISWTDIQVLRMEKAYREELGELQQSLGTMVVMVNAQAEAVRAQVVADEITHLVNRSDLQALEPQRMQMLVAAEALRSWATGVGDREDAVQQIERAAELLERADRGF